MLDKVVHDQIRSEIQQIEDLFSEFAHLLDKSAVGEPDLVERVALGSVLHSFYTGVEGIFLTIAKRVDEHVPAGDRWHRDLLDQVATSRGLRGVLISEETKKVLREYLAFRHFFRQAYTYVLRWEEMRDLVERLGPTWRQARAEIEVFLDA